MRTHEPRRGRPQPDAVSLDVARALQRDARAAHRASEVARQQTAEARDQAAGAHRLLAEAQRQAAEAQRQAAEAQRQAAEAQRQAAEARGLLAAAQQEAEDTRARLRRAQPRPEQREPGAGAAPEDERLARLSADLANVRRHQQEAIERARLDGLSRGLLITADVGDALSRALETLPGDEVVADGLRRLLHQVRSGLASAGAQPLGAPDEPFDPTRHEAVGTTAGPRPDRIAAVVRSGVALEDGTVLRPAQVVVTQTPEQS